MLTEGWLHNVYGDKSTTFTSIIQCPANLLPRMGLSVSVMMVTLHWKKHCGRGPFPYCICGTIKDKVEVWISIFIGWTHILNNSLCACKANIKLAWGLAFTSRGFTASSSILVVSSNLYRGLLQRGLSVCPSKTSCGWNPQWITTEEMAL